MNISTYIFCYVIPNTAGSFWLEFSQFLHIRYFILFTHHSPKAFLLIFNTYFLCGLRMCMKNIQVQLKSISH